MTEADWVESIRQIRRSAQLVFLIWGTGSVPLWVRDLDGYRSIGTPADWTRPIEWVARVEATEADVRRYSTVDLSVKGFEVLRCPERRDRQVIHV